MQKEQIQKIEDELRIRVVIEENCVNLRLFSRVLKIWSESFPPDATKIRLANGIDYDISGFLDPFVLSSLEQELNGDKNLIQLFFKDESNATVLDPSGTIYNLTETKYLNISSENELITFLKRLIAKSQPAFVECALRRISREIYRKHFEWEDRTNISPNLVWLQYFGTEEFQRQGGKAIFDNPYIKGDQLGDGILIQVGESLFDAYTPEGEELFVNATKAMPPVRS